MNIIECPECEGTGVGASGNECDFPGCFKGEDGSHLIELGDYVLAEDEDDANEDFVESGPEWQPTNNKGEPPVTEDNKADLQSEAPTAALQASRIADKADEVSEKAREIAAMTNNVATFAVVDGETVPLVEAPVDFPPDPIGVVIIGQDDGLAHFVKRALGGDEGPITATDFEGLTEWQTEHGIEDEPHNAIVGRNWAWVLPDVQVGEAGWLANIFLKVNGLAPGNTISPDDMHNAFAKLYGPEDTLPQTWTTPDWLQVL